MRILITGGAGYIGSHVTWLLRREGHQPVVFDNLSTGHADAVPAGVPLNQGDLLDVAAVRRAFEEHAPEAVMHFAALALVAESVRDPRRYFHENIVGALNLLDVMREHEVRHFVFSSTAATYGDPIQVPIPEDHPQQPVNPYGHTKLAIERMLASYDDAYGLRHATLRYFNAAGALPDEGLGERHRTETHLIPLLLAVPLGRAPGARIFGRDYDTPDGTCIRDYIHVLDLADAHLLALSHIVDHDRSVVLNLGTGSGHSVLEVLDEARRITGHPIPASDHPRRSGDPPVLVAAARRAGDVLGWQARRSDLPSIITSAWEFHRG
jgi:UDP-glucose-4-epimerase GalE